MLATLRNSQLLKIDALLLIFFILFPISLISIKPLGNVLLLAIVIIGLYRIFKEKINPFKESELRLFSYLMIGYFLIMLFSIILSVGIGEELKHIARKLHFLLAPIVAVAFYKKSLDFKNFLIFTKIAIILNAIYFFLKIHYGEFDVTDQSTPIGHEGMLNSNVYGDLIVTLTFISISNIFSENKYNFFLSSLTFFCGMYLLLISYSRGSWLAFAILLTVFFIYNYKRILEYTDARKKAGLILLVMFSFTAYKIADFNSVVQRTVANIESSSNDNKLHNSSNSRILMWQASLLALKDAPWHGFGYRLANKEVAKYATSKSKSFSKFTHLHNEYLTHLLSAGVFGLIYLLIVLILPVYFSLKFKRKNDKNPIPLSIVILSTSYASFGLTHMAFGEENLNALYIFLISFLLPKVFVKKS